MPDFELSALRYGFSLIVSAVYVIFCGKLWPSPQWKTMRGILLYSITNGIGNIAIYIAGEHLAKNMLAVYLSNTVRPFFDSNDLQIYYIMFVYP